MVEKLTSSKLANIDREGELIKSCLTNLVESFPNHAKSITGMSKWLVANKSTCQRMVETLFKTTNGLQVVQLLPGPKGILSFIKLAVKKHINSQLIDEATIAVERFENIIYEYARSHSALKKLIIDSSKKDSGRINKAEQRKALYEAVKNLTGEIIDTEFKLFILKDSTVDNKYLQHYILSYLENCEFRENSRPILFPFFPNEDASTVPSPNIIDKDSKLDKQLPALSFLKEYTSDNVLNNLEDTIFDDSWAVMPTDTNKTNNYDFGIIKNYPMEQLGPFFGGTKASCASTIVRCATKKLNVLCFLERKYAMRSVASVSIYSTHTKQVNLLANPESLWFDRFQDDIDLNLYDSDIDYSDKLQHKKANELVDRFFKLSGCNKEDFSCYLIQVDYPIWSSHYRIYFQYAAD